MKTIFAHPLSMEVMLIPAKVGMQSMVGVHSKDYPVRFGNYFAFAPTDNTSLSGRLWCWNFWSENLVEAQKRFLTDGKVQIRHYTWRRNPLDGGSPILGGCIIDDSRIPDNWYYKRMCFTGSTRPPLSVAQDIYSIKGDPSKELLYWTDHEEYKKRRSSRVIGSA